jgi:hypothetical protein
VKAAFKQVEAAMVRHYNTWGKVEMRHCTCTCALLKPTSADLADMLKVDKYKVRGLQVPLTGLSFIARLNPES